MMLFHKVGANLCTDDPATVSDFIAQQDAAGFGFRSPLHRAALAGDVQVVELLPRGRVPKVVLDSSRPVIVVVGDDGLLSRGPDDFPQARRLAAWTVAVMLHAAGGEAAHYAAAVGWVRSYYRVLLVETATARADAWREVFNTEAARRDRASLPPLRGAQVICRPGVAHPAPNNSASGGAA